MSSVSAASRFPLRGRVQDISLACRDGALEARVAVATDYGLLEATLDPAVPDGFRLVVGADIVARVGAERISLAPA